MAGNSFGSAFRFTTWGESHGPALGCVIDGVPPLIALSEELIQPHLDKRRPGQSRYTTQRREPDQVEILSGVFEGQTTGTPIQLQIKNQDQRSKDYSEIAAKFRPRPRRLHLLGQVRHPRLPRRRAVQRPRDRSTGGGRRGGAGAGP